MRPIGRAVAMGRRRSWRVRFAKLVLVGGLVGHGALLVRGGSDAHKLFGFRPFNESDSWRGDIVRVTRSGDRIPIGDGTWEYDWDELVGTSRLRGPGRLRHASAGADATIDFLDRALDWVIDELPENSDTVALEATVTVFHNTRGPEVIVLRSGDGS